MHFISTLAQTFLRPHNGGVKPNPQAQDTAVAAGIVLLRGFIPPSAIELIVDGTDLPEKIPHREELMRIAKLKSGATKALQGNDKKYFTCEMLDCVKKWYADAPAIGGVEAQDGE